MSPQTRQTRRLQHLPIYAFLICAYYFYLTCFYAMFVLNRTVQDFILIRVIEIKYYFKDPFPYPRHIEI